MACRYILAFAFVALLGCKTQAQFLPDDKTEMKMINRFDISPDSKQLTVSWNGSLWQSTIDGGKATRLTNHPGVDSQPRYSPDGKMLAFASNPVTAAKKPTTQR